MIKIVHIITGLEARGAEVVLANLLSRSDRKSFDPSVISLTNRGAIASRIKHMGIPVSALGMSRDHLNISPMLKLARILRQIKPDIVQTWMYHANFAGGIAARLAGNIPTIWGIHATRINPDRMSWKTRATVHASTWLSPSLASRIVCCSLESFRYHLVLGFAAEKLLYIPNGFDTGRFQPNPHVSDDFRRELGLGPDTHLIGYVARYDPQKDHQTFLAAAAKFANLDPDAHFVLCGTDVTPDNRDLVDLISRHGLIDRCHLLGVREDMPRITASFDLATTASAYGEAFPLVIGEAMACGVPCVVTEVGDSALIIGETGLSVPPRNPDALVAGWNELISLPSARFEDLRHQARARIVENFPLHRMTRSYEEVYRSAIATAPA